MAFKLLEKIFRRGSAFVKLLDGFTGEVATLPVKLEVKSAGSDGPGSKVEFVAKRPGEYGFVDLASGEYGISWESKYFFKSDDDNPETFSYNVNDGYEGPKVVTLRPSPAYPFPPGATLLRGVVVDAAEKPVEGASVSVVERPEVDSETDGKGEFVIFFKDLKYTEGNDSDFYKVLEDGKWVYYVVPKGGSVSDIDLTVRAESGGASEDVKVRVAAEKVNTLGLDEEDKPKRIKLPL